MTLVSPLPKTSLSPELLVLVATLRDGAITPGRGLVAILISLCSKKKSSLSFSEFATWEQPALEQLVWEQRRERLDEELERPSCEFSSLFFRKVSKDLRLF